MPEDPRPPAAQSAGRGSPNQNVRPANRHPNRTLGPVPDLERHLPPDWWRTLFNAVYLKTDGDVVENDANTYAEVDRVISAAGLTTADRVLDVCCGQGRHSLAFAQRGFGRVVGVDRSRYLIRLARRRARQGGLNVEFHEGDARKLRVPESSFDVAVVMGNSFGYFAQAEEDARVLRAIKRALRSKGTIVLDLSDGDWLRGHFEPRSWEWIDENQFVCRERSLSEDGGRLISREVVVHAEKGVIADQFYAERLYGKADIEALLKEAGFTGIRFHDILEASSARNQDLGMMARRHLMTAEAPPKAARAKRTVPYPEVTVVMGDPRLPDTVKKGGQFNEEDLDTIQRLHDALDELSEYKFTYFDNHAAFEADITRRQPAFVLNLCDEGFDNDAFKELHVPAYLEMHNVPYSGAGPACLGLCYNKALVRAIAVSMDVPVPLETYYDPDDQAATLPSVLPALLKPATGDSSIGITQNAVVHTAEEAESYLRFLRETLPGRPVLVQEFLSGAEYSVGLVGNPGADLRALPVLEVDYGQLDPSLPKLLGYESKWIPDSPYWNQIRYRQAHLDDDARRRLIDHSSQLFERLDCRDYARFDFRADADGVIKLLEVNPNPGWCWDGKLNLMAGFEGMRYSELLRLILEAAQNRCATARSMRQAAA